MSFQGSLKELPLPDIIQLVSVSGKTGAFVLSSGHQEGRIFLRDGEIVHAVVGAVQGEEAVYELAIWQDGRFVFKAGIGSEIRTVEKSNTNLLMESARRIDEWKVLSKRVPSMNLVPVFASQGSPSSVSFTPNEWSVICKIDERRNIEDLASVLGISAFEVSKLLYGLLTAGLIELHEGLDAPQLARLAGLSAPELEHLVSDLSGWARELLQDQERRVEIERASERARVELTRGRGGDAVVELIRALECLVSTALGPSQGQLLLKRLHQKLQA